MKVRDLIVGDKVIIRGRSYTWDGDFLESDNPYEYGSRRLFANDDIDQALRDDVDIDRMNFYTDAEISIKRLTYTKIYTNR